jgi:GNAT superfamily N-acetyltransferase
MSIKIRQMDPTRDMERLRELSPEAEGQAPGSAAHKDPTDFVVYPTIVAVADLATARRMVKAGEVPKSAVSPDGLVVGYAQFSLGVDSILHSRAIRVSRKFKNQGIGALLCAERVRLARLAGATFHLYGIHPEQRALQTVVEKLGMHCCRKLPTIWLYAQDLGADVLEEDDPGYTEPEWETLTDMPEHPPEIGGGV